MQRLKFQDDDQALINRWVNDSFVGVIELTEGMLRATGFHPRTAVEANKLVTRVYRGDRLCGLIDINKILFAIATYHSSFDHRLGNPLYEVTKIHAAIRNRILAARILFADPDPMDRLCDLTKQTGLRFIVVHPD